MIRNEDGEKCSAKDLANEILIRCLGNISSYLRENPDTLELLTAKENLALNEQLVKQATRCYKLLGVHPEDIGEIFDPEDPSPQPNAVNAVGELLTDDEKLALRTDNRQADVVDSES